MKTCPLYLNENWTTTSNTFEVVNPSTGEAFARMSATDRAGVAKAVHDANAAFGPWKRLPGKARSEMLERIAGELECRTDEIARIITLENGNRCHKVRRKL